jgi:hypothetical protein
MIKTTLAPGAPWPEKKLYKQSGWRKVQIDNIDYFKETHNELLQPQKRGRGNPNAGKNFEKFNLRSL